MFIRFAEIIPSLENLPIYQAVIGACLIAAFPRVVRQLSLSRLAANPITVCVLGMLVAIVLSHVTHSDFFDAREAAAEFLKILAYYLLACAVIDSPARLRTFLKWLTVFILALTALALLQYYGWINIPSLSEYAEIEDDLGGPEFVLVRLVSTGIFNDPNDLSLVLIFGMFLAFYFFEDRRRNWWAYFWLIPALVFLFAVSKTYSRGGFVALAGGTLTLFTVRFGWRKALLACLLVSPAILFLFGGRQTDITTDSGTGHHRLYLWREGLMLIRGTSALFGIGKGVFEEEIGYVAHNSFIHSYVELGLFGGTIFFGAFYAMLVGLRRVISGQFHAIGANRQRLAAYLMAIVVAYTIGYMTLSRPYTITTYLVFALVSIYMDLIGREVIWPHWRLTRRQVIRVATASAIFFVCLHLFVRFAMAGT